jgi:uncharacterized protein DUF4832/glycosyl hydrolase family 42 (putative beta-galactosidase)
MSRWMLPLGFAALAPLVFAAFAGSSGAGARRVVREPRETDELFANPGIGWQTFHTFADEDRNLEGLPSAGAYFRFYWREIEPTAGQIDFARFDTLLAHAKKAGQKLAFRIMCTGSSQYMDAPQWLKDEGCKGVEFQYGENGERHWVPNWEDPLFLKAHFRLIRELGRRYDGHPDLDLVDIGSIGLWGEWHMSGTRQITDGQPVPMPTVPTRLAIIDAWRAAFPHTPKVMLIGDAEGMRHAVHHGCGWRADCLGDMGGFSKSWNHMQNFYLQQLQKTDAEAAWRTAPVAFESCWDMRKWKQEGWDIGFIFDYALRCHASYLNNKSAPIPDGTRGEIERFLRKMGYRLVLRRVEYDPAAPPGSTLHASMLWENAGVAPPYRDYRLALRLSPAHGEPPAPLISVGRSSIQGWLPGRREVTEPLALPSRLRPGRYELALAVVDPHTRQPAVRLAIRGRAADGWYPLGPVEVRAAR